LPLALALVGVVLVLVGVRGTYPQLGSLLREEFVGPANFTYRAAAILMVGVIGYAGEQWRNLSVALMSLLVLGLLLSRDQDFFSQLGKGVAATPTSAPAGTPPQGGATRTGLPALPPIPGIPGTPSERTGINPLDVARIAIGA
jgi:hypothetical protein